MGPSVELTRIIEGCKSGDAESFAAALDAELKRPDAGAAARRAERADWLQRFEPEAITARYLELIREVSAT